MEDTRCGITFDGRRILPRAKPKGKTMSKKKRTPPRKANGQFRKRKKR